MAYVEGRFASSGEARLTGCQALDPQPQARLLVVAGPSRAKSLWVLSSLDSNPRQGWVIPQTTVRSGELLWLALALLGLSLRPIAERAKALLRVQ